GIGFELLYGASVLCTTQFRVERIRCPVCKSGSELRERCSLEHPFQALRIQLVCARDRHRLDDLVDIAAALLDPACSGWSDRLVEAEHGMRGNRGPERAVLAYGHIESEIADDQRPGKMLFQADCVRGGGHNSYAPSWQGASCFARQVFEGLGDSVVECV